MQREEFYENHYLSFPIAVIPSHEVALSFSDCWNGRQELFSLEGVN